MDVGRRDGPHDTHNSLGDSTTSVSMAAQEERVLMLLLPGL